MDIVSTIIFKRVLDDFPCFAAVVFEKTGDVFENEDFRAAFFDDTSKLAKQCASGIFETTTGTYKREKA